MAHGAWGIPMRSLQLRRCRNGVEAMASGGASDHQMTETRTSRDRRGSRKNPEIGRSRKSPGTPSAALNVQTAAEPRKSGDATNASGPRAEMNAGQTTRSAPGTGIETGTGTAAGQMTRIAPATATAAGGGRTVTAVQSATTGAGQLIDRLKGEGGGATEMIAQMLPASGSGGRCLAKWPLSQPLVAPKYDCELEGSVGAPTAPRGAMMRGSALWTPGSI